VRVQQPIAAQPQGRISTGSSNHGIPPRGDTANGRRVAVDDDTPPIRYRYKYIKQGFSACALRCTQNWFGLVPLKKSSLTRLSHLPVPITSQKTVRKPFCKKCSTLQPAWQLRSSEKILFALSHRLNLSSRTRVATKSLRPNHTLSLSLLARVVYRTPHAQANTLKPSPTQHMCPPGAERAERVE
jgi:hypothetical protein